LAVFYIPVFIQERPVSINRMNRVNELLKREIGAALFQIMDEASFDLSSVTVTHVVTSRNLRQARVLVSIRDHHQERRKMLSLLRRHRRRIQDRISRNIVLKYTPRLSFELDTSLERGDHVLRILSEMEGARGADCGGGCGAESEPSQVE
jgi:ribosome-binding factor A